MQKMTLHTTEKLQAIVCDRCGRESDIEDTFGAFEAVEFTSIQYVGGYYSIFGDGARISLDICQHCLKETLGEWLKIDTENC